MAVPLQVELPRDHYTVEDWLDLSASEGQRVELIDGSFVVSLTPRFRHQLCAGRLRTLLAAAAPDDFEVVEAFGVRAKEHVPVPDVVVADADVVLRDPAMLLPEQTHLVAEIVCPGHPRRDYHDKPRIYAEAGIPTFLHIELAGMAPPYVELLRLHDGAYTLVAKANAGQTLELAEPFPVTFDPGHLLGRRAR